MIDKVAEFPSLDPRTGKLRPEHVPPSEDSATTEDLEKFQNQIDLIDGVFWAGDGPPTPTWINAVRASGKIPLDVKQVRKGDRLAPRLNSEYELILGVTTFNPLTGSPSITDVNVGNVRGVKGADGSNVLPTSEAIDNALNVSSSIFNVTQLRRAR